ncbi:hypothetical protein [Mycobacterium lepromatosis]|nr:hypothetical protein [Mycobacterium lepromatosis]
MALSGPGVDIASLADALGDLRVAISYSVLGYQRICVLADELIALRGYLCLSCPTWLLKYVVCRA